MITPMIRSSAKAARPIKDKAARHLSGLLVALVFGALGGAAALAFHAAATLVQTWIYGPSPGYDLSDGIRYLASHWRIAVPIVGAFVAGVILYWAMRIERRTQDASDYLEVIDGRAERVPVASSLLRCLSSFSSIVSGGSVGKEGPMVQLAAVVASYLSSDWRHVSPERVRTTIAIAAAGGLAAVYHAPLASAVFIAEIAYSGLQAKRVALLFVGASAATGLVIATGHYTPLYVVPVQQLPWNASTLAWIVAAAIVGALAGMVLMAAVRRTRRHLGRWVPHIVVRMTLGGVVLAGLLWVAPDVAGNGYGPVAKLLLGEGLLAPLLIVLVAKIVATAVTVGAGAVGGLFTPALMVGALAAAQFGPWVTQIDGSASTLVALMILGMAASLAATTQAPLMATLMVIELTRQTELIFPIALASVVAFGLARLLGQPAAYAITDRHMARADERNALRSLNVDAFLRPAGQTLPADATAWQAREMAAASTNRFLFTVDRDGKYLAALPVYRLLALDGSEPELAIQSLAEQGVPVLLQGQTIYSAWETLAVSPSERIPIVDNASSRRLLGFLHKSELLKRARATLDA